MPERPRRAGGEGRAQASQRSADVCHPRPRLLFPVGAHEVNTKIAAATPRENARESTEAAALEPMTFHQKNPDKPMAVIYKANDPVQVCSIRIMYLH